MPGGKIQVILKAKTNKRYSLDIYYTKQFNYIIKGFMLKTNRRCYLNSAQPFMGLL